MICLAIIWLVFATIFLALGCFHWKKAGESISNLQLEQLMQGVTIKLMGIDFQKFVENFNKYIDYNNKKSKEQNKAQAIGYWVASLIALFSFVLVIVS